LDSNSRSKTRKNIEIEQINQIPEGGGRIHVKYEHLFRRVCGFPDIGLTSRRVRKSPKLPAVPLDLFLFCVHVKMFDFGGVLGRIQLIWVRFQKMGYF
jgi:hypothetical protein